MHFIQSILIGNRWRGDLISANHSTWRSWCLCKPLIIERVSFSEYIWFFWFSSFLLFSSLFSLFFSFPPTFHLLQRPAGLLLATSPAIGKGLRCLTDRRAKVFVALPSTWGQRCSGSSREPRPWFCIESAFSAIWLPWDLAARTERSRSIVPQTPNRGGASRSMGSGVLQGKHLNWKFRGSKRVEVDGVSIQVSWDVYN